jgi:hypothetical protein
MKRYAMVIEDAGPNMSKSTPVEAMEPLENKVNAPQPTWAVHRQDDHGNTFVVAKGLCREEAERLVVLYEKRGHKQLYWAQVEQR